MSKQINVNPGQYKVAGRTRQGEDVVHDRQRRRLSEAEAEERQRAARARPRTRRKSQAMPPEQE